MENALVSEILENAAELGLGDAIRSPGSIGRHGRAAVYAVIVDGVMVDAKAVEQALLTVNVLHMDRETVERVITACVSSK
jgi:hypothetical protein